MKFKDLKTLIECMKETYEEDLKDSELMNTKCSFRQVADTNIKNLTIVLKALDEINDWTEE